jgi:A/G-specific adenine glycosylase
MITPAIISLFHQDLLDWYSNNSRSLPWRESVDPYRIWVAEIMLQQTQVETVIPFYKRWMRSFPDIKTLATAEEDKVLNLWEGLGYYQRAHNLHRTAKLVAERYQGMIPSDPKELEQLPGIGPYTAGAVASIGFGERSPLIDGNIRRVFCRFFNISAPIQENKTEALLWQIAADLLPENDPGTFNQALMELGALVCQPRNPHCSSCPLQSECLAKIHNIQHKRPVRRSKKTLPHYQVAAGVINKDGLVLLAKRPQKGLLGGLWEFPGGTQEKGETLSETLRREILEELDLRIEVGDRIGKYSHAYTHYKVSLHAFHCKPLTLEVKLNYHTQYRWISMEELSEYPMGKLDRMIADQIRSLSA